VGKVSSIFMRCWLICVCGVEVLCVDVLGGGGALPCVVFVRLSFIVEGFLICIIP
jgi:hypothetical protein